MSGKVVPTLLQVDTFGVLCQTKSNIPVGMVTYPFIRKQPGEKL